MKFILINKNASSLHSLIADERFCSTSLDRASWKSLIGSEASLETGCVKEGFNANGRTVKHSKARIGIIGCQQCSCPAAPTRIGFGTWGTPDFNNTCGNAAYSQADNGDKQIKAMGYILVQ